MDQPTNAPTNAPAIPAGAMDMRTFGRMFLGRREGQQVTKDEFEADKKAYEYYIKKSIDNKFSPELLNTQQGLYARYDGTNAVPIAPMMTNAAGQMERGEQLRGYAADPAMSGGPAPTLGGGTFAGTNAPTPVQTASPSPTPYPDGAKIRSKRDGKLYQVVNGIPQLIPGQ